MGEGAPIYHRMSFAFPLSPRERGGVRAHLFTTALPFMADGKEQILRRYAPQDDRYVRSVPQDDRYVRSAPQDDKPGQSTIPYTFFSFHFPRRKIVVLTTASVENAIAIAANTPRGPQ